MLQLNHTAWLLIALGTKMWNQNLFHPNVLVGNGAKTTRTEVNVKFKF